MDVGDLKTIRQRHGGGEDVGAADDHDLVDAAFLGVLAGEIERRLEARRDLGAFGGKIRNRG